MFNMKYYSHPSSIIDDGASIGKNTKIWHFSHISSGAVLGNKVSIGQNVYISNNVKIGDNCKIQNNVSIYEGVILEDNVFCGPSMVFTNVINPRSNVIRKNEFKTTLIKKGVTIGANATIVCGITINEHAFIGAGALVNKNVKKYSLMVGLPAKQVGWMSEYGLKIPLNLTGDGKYTCPKTKIKYFLFKGEMYTK